MNCADIPIPACAPWQWPLFKIAREPERRLAAKLLTCDDPTKSDRVIYQTSLFLVWGEVYKTIGSGLRGSPMSDRLFTLCLSGGGFRATLFHLGVIRALRDYGLLGRVARIYSVSGGSILAAHLVLKWERYTGTEDTFRETAQELIDFVRSDLRGRLVRRWVVAGWLPPYRRSQQLIRAYDKLYDGAVLETLGATNRPKVCILATSLISGDLCAFTSKGLCQNCTTDRKEVTMIPHLPVSVAVAASSAFPPLFPPVHLNRRDLGVIGPELPAGEILSDGGVFDNLGIRAASLEKEDKENILIISDASGPFRTEASQGYGFIIVRTKRTTDILMKRVCMLESELTADKRNPPVFASISHVIRQEEIPKTLTKLQVQPSAIQNWIKLVRTDLDVFSDLEIRTIYRHGVEVGAAKFRS
jgi:predicted acylesterase/phospholipase RssA